MNAQQQFLSAIGRHGRLALLLAVLLAIGTGAALAAGNTYYFTTTSNNWNAAGNWTPAGGPPGASSLDAAYIGTTKGSGVSPATAVIVNGDTIACTNVDVGCCYSGASGIGSLNITGGSAAFSNLTLGDISGGSALGLGSNYISGGLLSVSNYICANQGTGVVVQTGGTVILNTLTFCGANSADSGSWTLAGGVLTNNGYVYMGKRGTASMIVTNGGTMVNNSKFYLSYSSQTPPAYGQLTVNNGTCLFNSGIYLANGNGSPAQGVLLQNPGSLIVVGGGSGVLIGYASGDNGQWIMTGGLTTNLNSAYLGFAPGATGTWVMAGGTTYSTAGIYIGSANSGNPSKAGSGFLIVSNNATLIVANNIYCSYYGTNGAASSSFLISNALVVCNNLSVGVLASLSHPTNTISSSLTLLPSATLTNLGSVTIGAAPGSGMSLGGPTSVGMTGATWSVNGTMNVLSGMVSIANGRLSVSNGVSLGTNATTWVQCAFSNTVFSNVCGNVTLGSIASSTMPALVNLTGTNRTFQVSNLVVNAYGALTNYVAGSAGGLDITSSASSALALTGSVSLVFSGNPMATGKYWGLRWLGNHTNALTSYMASTNLITVNQISASYSNPIAVTYDGTYTYVGMTITSLINAGAGIGMFF